jgi:glycosyltransferase involved in cell wall biosynthesis
MMSYPKVVIVTPCLNEQRYIEEAMDSVLGQGYPNLDYIVVDGASQDGTMEIVERHAKNIRHVLSEPDEGVYHAINKGFAFSDAEIMGWLSADDLLHRRSLFTIAEIFRSFPSVEWITGTPTNIDHEGRFFPSSLCLDWDFEKLLKFENGMPQQESTFWRRSLWERAGGRLDGNYRYAADYDLWCRFFCEAPLYSARALLGGFRKHKMSLSFQNEQGYREEARSIASRYLQGRGKLKREYRSAHGRRANVIAYHFGAQQFRILGEEANAQANKKSEQR